MYKKLPNLVLGFHGCNKDTYDKVIFSGEQLRRSENSYDWLGHGIYFWEHNFVRAQDWAKQRYGEENGRVIGAVIDLGYCLNLTDSFASAYLATGYELLKIRCECSTRLRVSVCGTGAPRIGLSGFSGKYDYPRYRLPPEGTPYCQVRLGRRICLPSS